MGKTVVVVDDDEGLREVMAEALLLGGYDVMTAGSGAQALALLQGAPRPCVAIVDLVMPGLDGAALMRKIGEDASLGDIPLVCCTAGRSAPPPGFVATLFKPFDYEHLAEVVRDAFAAAERLPR